MIRGTVAALALLAAPLAAQQPEAARDTVPRDTARSIALDLVARSESDTVITPAPDQARGVDAELRVALFELAQERHLQALGRLEWLHESPDAVPAATGDASLRGRDDLFFLLAESYYRLGVSEPFRAAARALLSSAAPDRYRVLVQPQLLMDAYRRAEYERAIRLADTVAMNQASTQTRAFASLIAGLSAYQLRRYPEAQTAFASARQAGPPYGAMAGYMEALTRLRSDTAQVGPALAALQSVAGEVSGPFADQVRLTAAQLAYEAEQYAEAARIAGAIDAGSVVGAQALLTRAWALYKADQLEPAVQAFQEFARRFPQLPEQEESLLMAAQALLQIGRTDEAAQLFRRVADSTAVAVTALRGAGDRMSQTATMLVNARASGLLFIADPASGKAVALEDAAGAQWGVLAAGFGDAPAPDATVAIGGIVSLNEVLARLDSITRGADTAVAAASMGDVPRRVFFTQASATTARGEYAATSQELFAADVDVALARCQLAEATAALAVRIALLEQLRSTLEDESRLFAETAAALTLAQDSLARLNSVLDDAALRLRQMFEAQTSVTRMLAAENASTIDSLRTSMAGSLGENETLVLGYEAQTANIYGQVAALIEGELDRAIQRHPVFALRDSVRARGDSLRRLLGSTQQLVASTRQAIDEELNRLRAGGPERIQVLRSTLAAAEARVAAVESQMIALVNTELNARGGELLAELQRGVEAAEFGSASAAFFQALDAGRVSAGGAGGAVSVRSPAQHQTGESAALPPLPQE